MNPVHSYSGTYRASDHIGNITVEFSECFLLKGAGQNVISTPNGQKSSYNHTESSPTYYTIKTKGIDDASAGN